MCNASTQTNKGARWRGVVQTVINRRVVARKQCSETPQQGGNIKNIKSTLCWCLVSHGETACAPRETVQPHDRRPDFGSAKLTQQWKKALPRSQRQWLHATAVVAVGRQREEPEARSAGGLQGWRLSTCACDAHHWTWQTGATADETPQGCSKRCPGCFHDLGATAHPAMIVQEPAPANHLQSEERRCRRPRVRVSRRHVC